MNADLFSFDPRFLWLALPIFLSFTTEAMTGFGSIVIAVTIAANFLPIKEVLPILVTLNLFLSGYIVSRHRRHIDWKLLLTVILPWTGIGVAVGLSLFHFAEGDLLKRLFGFLVVFFAIRELWSLGRSDPESTNQSMPDPRDGGAATVAGDIDWKSLPWLLASGITHGLYASGGPLLVYALGRIHLPKAIFRATLSTVWLSLNLAMAVGYLGMSAIGSAQLQLIVVFFPIVLISIVLGEWLHHRVDEYRFRLAIFTILLFAGGSLLWS